jgi:DNA-directed RNA polymerase specialized sigma24 family protein
VHEDAVVTDRTPAGVDVERLYREQGTKLWRAVMSFAGDRSITDEAVAEAFAQLLARGEAVKKPSAWVWKAAFRIAAGELQRGRRSVAPSDSGSYEVPDPLPEVLAALGSLPPVQRAVVVMHDYADRPAAEIADTLGIARSTVRVHLSQARRRLRKILEETDE